MTAEKDKTTLSQLAKRCGFSFKHGAKLPYEKQDEWQQNANSYRCTLRYKGRQYSFDYWQGVGITHDPNAEGCLDSLLSDAAVSESFEDFCAEFGYDTDSRRAERTHKACLKNREELERLFGDDFETFLYAERD